MILRLSRSTDFRNAWKTAGGSRYRGRSAMPGPRMGPGGPHTPLGSGDGDYARGPRASLRHRTEHGRLRHVGTGGRMSNRFAAAVPICGGGDPRWAEQLKDLPIWVFHGAKDDTVPLSALRRWSTPWSPRAATCSLRFIRTRVTTAGRRPTTIRGFTSGARTAAAIGPNLTWAAPLRRIGVDVTIIITMLYVRNDPIQLVWMVKQAGRLNASSPQPPVFPLPRPPPLAAAEAKGGLFLGLHP